MLPSLATVEKKRKLSIFHFSKTNFFPRQNNRSMRKGGGKGRRMGKRVVMQGKARQGNFIYIALFIHKADSKCFTYKHCHTIKNLVLSLELQSRF
jgi:hypothetical protein